MKWREKNTYENVTVASNRIILETFRIHNSN